ncbi:MAG: TolB family protein, partial [Vicinamibacterales bacterium]
MNNTVQAAGRVRASQSTRTTSACVFALALALGVLTPDSQIAAQHAVSASTASGSTSERDFLSRVRRLTVEGRRAGEGYWSPDGTRLVFQSEREPGNPFYQIYVLDLTTGESS